jgi:DivIVA domain-containing protein
MPFAPHEIENKKFVVGLRGYATHEVEGFLRAVAADYAALQERAAAANPASYEIEGLMRAAGEEAARITHTAQEDAAEIRRQAEEDAELVRSAVAAEVAQLRATALAQIEREVEELERKRDAARRAEARVRDRLFSLDIASELAQRRGHADAPLTAELLAGSA